MAVDALAEHWRLSFNRQRSRAEIAEGFAEGYKIILAKPQTFMNNSGEAVRPLLKMNNLTPANLLVIADDMDLPFGRLRLRDKGSSGGQRGIRNIIDQVGTDQFARLRVGIGRPRRWSTPSTTSSRTSAAAKPPNSVPSSTAPSKASKLSLPRESPRR